MTTTLMCVAWVTFLVIILYAATLLGRYVRLRMKL